VPAGLCGGDGVIRKLLRAFLDKAFDGDEVFAVGARISTHACELGPNLIDQELLLLRLGNGESSLQNIISELILHHCYNRTDAVLFGGHDLFNQHTSALRVGGNESLLANVGSKLVA